MLSRQRFCCNGLCVCLLVVFVALGAKANATNATLKMIYRCAKEKFSPITSARYDELSTSPENTKNGRETGVGVCGQPPPHHSSSSSSPVRLFNVASSVLRLLRLPPLHLLARLHRILKNSGAGPRPHASPRSSLQSLTMWHWPGCTLPQTSPFATPW